MSEEVRDEITTESNPTEPVAEANETVESTEEVQAEASEETPIAETEQPEEDNRGKQIHGYEKRIGKLTGRAKKAEAENSELAEKYAALEAKLEALTPVKTKDDFANENEYIDYRADKQAQAQIKKQETQLRVENDERQKQEAESKQWRETSTAFREQHPDFDKVLQSSRVDLEPNTLREIALMDDGPAVAYHIAQNVNLALDVADLSGGALVRKLNRIGVELEQGLLRKSITKAKPTPSIQGKGSAQVDDSKLSMDDWAKKRNKQRNYR